MAILCRDLGLLFIMVPGTGCTALGEVLKSMGGEYVPKEPVIVDGKQVVGIKHGSLGKLCRHKVLSEADRGNLVSFATVRNPFDIMVTRYVRRVGGWLETQLNGSKPLKYLDGVSDAERQKVLSRLDKDMKFTRERSFEEWLNARLDVHVPARMGLKRGQLR